MIESPGIYTIPFPVYLADPCPEPSLTSGIVRMICFDSSMHAQYEHPRLNPDRVREESEPMDIGRAAHALLLEGGGHIEIIDFPDWRTKAAKEAREAARALGKTPLLAHVCKDVIAMVEALRAQLDRHTDGGARMFTEGEPEQSIIWREEDVWCRARADWLRAEPTAIDDYKTTATSANPDNWTRTMFSAGKDVQAAWYLRGLRAVTGERLDDPASFRYCVQEVYPPFAASVIALNPDAMILAEKKCIYALEKWREARASGDWKGYPRRTAFATLPATHEAFWLEKEMR